MIQAVFLLGGKGTRLGLSSVPKPMVDFLGLPLIHRSLDTLASQGVTNFLFLTEHLSEVIENYFGDGSQFGVSITYSREIAPLGTAGCMKSASRLLEDEFIVIYGDILFDLDLNKFLNFSRKRQGLGSLCVHPNDHPFDSDLISKVEGGRIMKVYSKPHSDRLQARNLVNAAFYYLNKEILKYVPEKEGVVDWGRDVFPKLPFDSKKLYAYVTTEYIRDVGTSQRLSSAKEHWISGLVKNRNYSLPQRAIFFDRDGVINKEIGGVLRANQLKLLPGVAKGLSKLKQSSFLKIVVTNQPFLAKGMMTQDDLDKVHAKLDALLAEKGSFFDDLYFCPHHPEKGWPDEVTHLKIECDCRKPKSGMLTKAASDHNIDLSKSFMIGDRDVDMMAGKRVGSTTILISQKPLTPELEKISDHRVASFEAALQLIETIDN